MRQTAYLHSPRRSETFYFSMSCGQVRSQLDNWGGGGGHIFIYSCSAQLVAFEIDCFYGLRTRIYEYVPPPPIIELATGLVAVMPNH